MSKLKADKIIIHHSATVDSSSFSWGAIRHYHTKVKGWDDIGYHYGIERVDDAGGRFHIEKLIGRSILKSGAHTIGQNSSGIGVCVVGDYDKKAPSDWVLDVATDLVVDLCLTHSIDPGSIFGHREFANKTCPGSKFDMEHFVAIVKQKIGEV